jgi:hypothetical protein
MSSVKQRCRKYNHIKHLVDTNEYDISIIRRLGWLIVKHEATYLDGKQCHTGFDYYDNDMSKLGTPSCAQSSLDRSSNSPNFQEHLEDLEHDQARHQGIHGNGQGETC